MKEILINYGWEIIGAIVSAVFGYIALAVKKLADKHLTDNTKKAVAKTVVQAA